MSQKLLLRWVPKWYEAFDDRETGAFHERLADVFRPVRTGERRLHPQCRQLAIYSHARLQRNRLFFKPRLSRHFEDLRRLYHVPATGGWRYSVTDEGRPCDNTHDLYATAFVIFALVHYFRATRDPRAHELALSTLEFIDRRFRVRGLPGFAEALDDRLNIIPRARRQNPHMHLLEACLFAAETWDDAIFRHIADEMVALFFSHLYDAERNLLPEWFTDDLSPHPEKGRIVEPGHYYEWIWLLRKHAVLKGDPYRYESVCLRMLEWANTHGWDGTFGGIYDELNADGSVHSPTKRLWPFTEALKANALMLHDDDLAKQERKDRIAEMVKVFSGKYIDKRGFWTETLNRDLSPVTDYMPGSTPYHVYFGIMETRAILRARGPGKSVFVPVRNALYRLRRTLSFLVRKGREGIVKMAGPGA